MYVCGITPYDSPHLGNLITAFRFSVIRKYLEFSGLKGSYVQNITDVDDKIIVKSKATGKSPSEISEFYAQEFDHILESLEIPKPDFRPKVSEYIPQIVAYVSELISKGFAYSTEAGNVYFDISKKSDYGKLSRKNLDELYAGTRVETEKDKKHPLDFALWKSDDYHGASWDSPWGKGRPGWHIECSVMSNALLGSHIDIHGGGLDLMFPHHENELAQCEAHNDKPYVNFWLYSGLLNFRGEKMSKSIGNLILAKDAVKKYGAELLKFTILKYHYRSPIELSDALFLENINFLLALYRLFERIETLPHVTVTKEDMEHPDIVALMSGFQKAMDDDFHTPGALIALKKGIDDFEKKWCVRDEVGAAALLAALRKLGNVLGIFQANGAVMIDALLATYALIQGKSRLTEYEIKAKIQAMADARKYEKYDASDAIREELGKRGIKVAQRKDGEIEWFLDIAAAIPKP